MSAPERRVLGAAGVALALLAVVWLVLLPPPPRPAIPGPDQAELRRLMAFAQPDTVDEIGSATAAVTIRRDPFTAGAAAALAAGRSGGEAAAGAWGAGPWRLSAIMVAAGRRVAILNDRLVREGDAVGAGLRVARIQPDRVVLTGAAGRQVILELEQGKR